MADNFVDSPMCNTEFHKTEIPQGGPGEYDGEKEGPFGEYKRTSSPNGVKEKIRDGSVPKPSGQEDQF